MASACQFCMYVYRVTSWDIFIDYNFLLIWYFKVVMKLGKRFSEKRIFLGSVKRMKNFSCMSLLHKMLR